MYALAGCDDENGTEHLQKGWFYGPTQVALFFVNVT